jgi:predicted HTH transcriptional regulator
MTFDRPLEAIDAAVLAGLVHARVPEGRQLEYRETLPGEKRRDKREFLADVSAFANSAGGDLIYGIREAGGAAAAVVGLPGSNLDQERLRLEQLARGGIRPRIPGLRLKIIHRGADPPCLLVRVPRSSVGLHMVTLDGLNRF